MKPAINLSRILVGVLFIFSGLIKANDPLSLGYKMQEFFEIWNESLHKGSFFLNQPLINLFDYLHAHSLTLSVLMIAFEIIAGAALLLGWRFRVFAWLMLLLILFFTFLTAYALLAKHPDGTPKFKNCGCFGDCLPISPKTSFLKDIVLTLLIGFLFRHRRKIKPLFSERTSVFSMLGVTAFSLLIQWYVLSYLPFMDCLPYKRGNNIAEKMKMPANAIPDSTVITFVYIKDGTVVEFPEKDVPKNLDKDYLFVKTYDKEISPDTVVKTSMYVKGGSKVEFTADKFPKDFSTRAYTMLKRYDKIIRKGRNNQPPITGFRLSGLSDMDSTEIVLSQPYAILLFCENFSKPVSRWKNGFAKVYAAAKTKQIPVYMVTTQPAEGEKVVAVCSYDIASEPTGGGLSGRWSTQGALITHFADTQSIPSQA
ncbi:MAG TPA: MauE/DoxX family redox-associated membrane protein, partial [Chitinophagaceae bacterium]|nr:MauE/DoxX family redox-associated membrane protein [Chitinophagaceae bacterium]